jgi:hypothetical protein
MNTGLRFGCISCKGFRTFLSSVYRLCITNLGLDCHLNSRFNSVSHELKATAVAYFVRAWDQFSRLLVRPHARCSLEGEPA